MCSSTSFPSHVHVFIQYVPLAHARTHTHQPTHPPTPHARAPHTQHTHTKHAHTLASPPRPPAGLCGLDQVLEYDGDEVLTAREAVSFLRVQRGFSLDQCDQHQATAHAAMAGLGAGFRLLAFWALRRRLMRAGGGAA